MILNAVEYFDSDLDETYMIGDSWIDVLSAEKAGCKSVFVNWSFHSIGKQKSDYFIKNIHQLENLLLLEN